MIKEPLTPPVSGSFFRCRWLMEIIFTIDKAEHGPWRLSGTLDGEPIGQRLDFESGWDALYDLSLRALSMARDLRPEEALPKEAQADQDDAPL